MVLTRDDLDRGGGFDPKDLAPEVLVPLALLPNGAELAGLLEVEKDDPEPVICADCLTSLSWIPKGEPESLGKAKRKARARK